MDLCDSRGTDYNSEILNEFKFKYVITRYNNKSYLVTGVDFESTPNDKFTISFDGKEISYVQYFKERYGEEIKHMK